ncbi:MAG TPA: ubiquinone/menaquinone biosynthesis methyltransferase, partial [Stenomitos sp.]
WANPLPGGVHADLCCGSGDLTLLVARTLRGQGNIIGIDFSSQQLAIAQSRGQASPWAKSLAWIEADVLNLPLEDSSVDSLTMGYGLRNVASIEQALAEMFRILKPQGRAAILDFNRVETPWARQFQQWYLRQIVVPVATYFHLKEEYAYLETSLARFPTGPEQVALAKAAGFASATHYPIAGGMMGVLVMVKP